MSEESDKALAKTIQEIELLSIEQRIILAGIGIDLLMACSVMSWCGWTTEKGCKSYLHVQDLLPIIFLQAMNGNEKARKQMEELAQSEVSKKILEFRMKSFSVAFGGGISK